MTGFSLAAAVAVLAVLAGEVLVPALGLFLLLRRRVGISRDRGAALALAASPLVVCVAVIFAGRIGWTKGPYVAAALTAVVLGSALRRRELVGEFISQPVTRLWALTAGFWIAQETLIFCHGPFWTFDWEMHWHLSSVAYGYVAQGRWPVNPLRTLLLGVWSAPVLAVTNVADIEGHAYWAFQLAVPVAGSLALPAVYLWGERFGGQRCGRIAWFLALLCPGLVFWTLYTWPLTLAAMLVTLGAYLYASGTEAASRRGRIGCHVAAGVSLAAAFQAHPTAATCAVVLPAVACVAFPRRWPWALVAACGAISLLWAYAVVMRFPAESTSMFRDFFSATPMGQKRDLWGAFQQNLRASILPLDWSVFNFAAFRRDPARLLDATVNILFVTFPVIGTIGLAWARPKWRRADTVVALSLLGAALVPLSLFLNRQPITHAFVPAVLFLLAVAASGVQNLPRLLAIILWFFALGQYVAFRGAVLFFNAWPGGADAANLAIKHAQAIRYLVDQSWWVRPAALAALITCAAGLAHQWRSSRSVPG